MDAVLGGGMHLLYFTPDKSNKAGSQREDTNRI